MNRDKIYELSLQLRKNNPRLVSLAQNMLIGLKIPLSEIVESSYQKSQSFSFYKKNEKQAMKYLKCLKSLKIKGIEVRIRILANKDWQVLWKDNYYPFMITKKVRIIPLKYRNIYTGRVKSDIYLDTNIVFGNGLHPTTRFIAEFIGQKSKFICNFLDIGTGSGILSLVAWKSGVSDLSCIDLARQAVVRARKNFKENKCVPRILKAIDIKKFNSNKKFDFVAANLLTNELIANKKKIISLVKKGKYLAVSGISLSNYHFFKESFENKKMRCLESKKKGGWVAFLYKLS